MPATTEKAAEFQQVSIVKLTDDERTSGNISLEHVAEAITSMHRDGLVVLENAVDVDHMEKMNKILVEEAAIMAKLPTTHFNDVSIVLAGMQSWSITFGRKPGPSPPATCPKARL